MTRSERLEAIRKREAEATKGPWIERHGDVAASGEVLFGRKAELTPYTDDMFSILSPTGYAPAAVRTFAAHAREDIPWLLEEVARLEGAIATTESALCEWYCRDFNRRTNAELDAGVARAMAAVGNAKAQARESSDWGKEAGAAYLREIGHTGEKP